MSPPGASLPVGNSIARTPFQWHRPSVQSKAKTVVEYLAGLLEDSRETLQAIRQSSC